MVNQDDERRRIVEAAAELFEAEGVALVRNRAVAKRARTSTRHVAAVGDSRSALLRLVVSELPFPPVSTRIQEQAVEPLEPAAQALLRAARESFGDPASLWDTRELQALAVAPFDEELAAVMRERLSLRWDAVSAVVRQMRGSGSVDAAVDDTAAALHTLAVGVGLALLAPLSPRWASPSAYLALVARLLDSLASIEPPAINDDRPMRFWRVRATVPDSPSAVARLMRIVALLHADVLGLFGHGQKDDLQLVDLFLRVPDDLTEAGLGDALRAVSTDVVVAPGVPGDADDLATRILDVAAELATNPGSTPDMIADLVLADSVEVIDAAAGEDASANVMRLQWKPDRHILLRRSLAPFTRTERTRVSALMRLTEALAEARGEHVDVGWLDPVRGGRSVWVRMARPEDSDAVAAMHDRTSEATRYQRYFAPISDWREENLRRISGGHRGVTLVAMNQDGEIVALGNVFPDRPEDEGTAEVAVIVEDNYQGRGIGTRMLDHLIEMAERAGFRRLVGYVLADNDGMIRLMERTRLSWTKSADPELGSSVVRMEADL
jgi:RimJ/RimL family protein N-acetyltransferase/AcrR family transcriptional regulator